VNLRQEAVVVTKVLHSRIGLSDNRYFIMMIHVKEAEELPEDE